MIEATQRSLDDDFRVYISGDYCNAAIASENFPSIHLLGFVPEHEFFPSTACARGSDLTTNGNFLVCGAYEAVAAGLPLVLPDTPAQRTYFCGGTILAASDPDALVAAVRECLQESREAT